jgi:hypothetical protein
MKKTVGIQRMYSVAMPWLLGAAVFVLGYSSDIWLPRAHGSEFAELSDDLVLGLVVGMVGNWWLKRRNRQMTEKLRRVANINHLIRNELEVILYTAQGTSNVASIKHIEQSVGQISWILRELLGPGPAAVQPVIAAAAPPGVSVKTS